MKNNYTSKLFRWRLITERLSLGDEWPSNRGFNPRLGYCGHIGLKTP
jgi:hypothetical protein